jgi:hypothetical protein
VREKRSTILDVKNRQNQEKRSTILDVKNQQNHYFSSYEEPMTFAKMTVLK